MAIPGINAPIQKEGAAGALPVIPALNASKSYSPNNVIDNPFDYGSEGNDLTPVDQTMAAGGPVFMSEGGAGARYVEGEDGGTADTVDALLSSGEFVIPADVVSALANGNNKAGAKILDEFVRQVRAHKQENGVELPPDAKTPLEYIAEVQ